MTDHERAREQLEALYRTLTRIPWERPPNEPQNETLGSLLRYHFEAVSKVLQQHEYATQLAGKPVMTPTPTTNPYEGKNEE